MIARKPTGGNTSPRRNIPLSELEKRWNRDPFNFPLLRKVAAAHWLQIQIGLETSPVKIGPAFIVYCERCEGLFGGQAEVGDCGIVTMTGICSCGRRKRLNVREFLELQRFGGDQ